MNEKFFQLPAEKQQRIINAGFKVFSENSYKKSPMNEIAENAGISKALLFYYFSNKKELYLFLWSKAEEITTDYLTRCECFDSDDLFEMMERSMRAKFTLMAEHPHMSDFAVKAFYEKEAEIVPDIQERYLKSFAIKAHKVISALDPDDFVPGLDLKMMYREMYWASEGYLWEMNQRGALDAVQMEKDFQKLLDFWKSVYKRRKD